jgi:hypothetical protein
MGQKNREKVASMIERDYIMRMLNMMIAMLVRMIGYKNKKEYPEALLDIQVTGKTLLGIDRSLVDQFSVPQLMQLFGSDLSVAVPKAYVLGVLLKEEADIRELMSDPAAAEDIYGKSLSLLMETYLSAGAPVEPRHPELADAILDKLSRRQLSPDILERIFRYEEAMGRYAKAENALYALLDAHVEFLDEGIRFYERLLNKPDEALAAGNLPREEVLEGKRNLKRR